MTVRSFHDGFADPGAGPFIAAWQAAALLLLLVACGNVANVLLARGAERSREFAIRLALGAGRLRIAWQLLLEGVILGAAAGLAALPLAGAVLGAFRAALPSAILRFVAGWEHLQVEPRTIVVTAALAVVASAVCAVAPALSATRASATEGLRGGGRGETGGRRRTQVRAGLAVAQIAVTLALMSGAALSLRALNRVTSGPLGFAPDHVLTGRVSLSPDAYGDDERRRQFAERVLDGLASRPAVVSASFTSVLPYSGSNHVTSMWLPGAAPTPAGAVQVNLRKVSPDFFRTLRIPVLEGRGVETIDRPDTARVAIVSRALADRHWPRQSAVGQQVRLAPDGPWIIVVGIVGDVSHDWLMAPLEPTIYLPAPQSPPYSIDFTIRTVGDPLDVAADLSRVVQSVDPDQAVAGIRSLETVISDKTVGLRLASRTLGVIAAISFGVAVLGIYSLLSFLASRRTREFGVRAALGATPAQILRMTLRQALRITAGGVLLGSLLALLLGRVLESALFGVVSTSVPLLLAVATVVGLAALTAAYFPARRAAGADLMVALRE